LFFDLLAGKVLRGQVDRAAGSVDNIVELVQRLPWISVVYGSSCTVGSRIVRVKSYKIVVILSHRKIGNPRTHQVVSELQLIGERFPVFDKIDLFSLPTVHQKAKKKFIRLVHPFYLPFSAVAIFASSICIIEFLVAFILELVLV
jgi:hypothetical protein